MSDDPYGINVDNMTAFRLFMEDWKIEDGPEGLKREVKWELGTHDAGYTLAAAITTLDPTNKGLMNLQLRVVGANPDELLERAMRLLPAAEKLPV